MATTINAGRVRFVSRGTYNNSTQYYLFDLVDYNGSSYIAKENTIGNLPTNTTYWQLIAEKGNIGNEGPIGPTGNGISTITKTSTVGLVDTYTITYTNGNTTTFTVTNGEDGEVTQAQLDDLQEQVTDLQNNQLTGTAQGTEIDLTDSADSRVRSIELEGNSTQETTEGRNLFNVTDYNNIVFGNNGYATHTKDSNKITITTGDGSVSSGIYITKANLINYIKNYDVNQTYYVSMDIKINRNLVIQMGCDTRPTITVDKEARITVETLINNNGLIIYSTANTAGDTIEVSNIMISTTNDNTYEKYTGGIPSPNPQYPQPIYSAGDNGTITEKIVNVNLYDNITYPLIDNRAINENTGDIYASSSGNYCATEAYIPFNFAGKTISKTSTMTLVYYNANKEYIGKLTSQTGVVPANTKYVRFDITKAQKDNVQIEFSNSQTPYVAHQEQTFIIPTQQPMRKIGDVRDFFFKNTKDSEYYDSTLTENAWYEKHNIKRYIFTGNENFAISNNVFYGASIITDYISSLGNICLCNFYKSQNNVNNSASITVNNRICFYVSTQTIRLYIRDERFTTVADLKAWLQEKNENNDFVYLDYIIETPVNLLCTPEQTQALEAYVKARTYKPVTHFYSEDETPAYQNVVYVKDLETVINNLGGA